MATDIVQQWISNEVKLSKLVSSFESDFANGYLFGEILQQYSLINDLSNFSKKTNKEAKVKNFQQVEEVLRSLKIKFDAKLIHSIMNEERGASLRLLYQIKLAIEKATGKTGGFKTTTNLKEETVNKKLEQQLNLKTTLPKTSNFQTMNKSKKLEAIEKTLLPFEYKKKAQEDKALEDHRREQELIKSLLQDQRQMNLTKMDENRQFMKEWEKEGKQNWKKNQDKRQDTIARQKYFEDKEVKTYINKLNKELDEATKELCGGIDEFERNLQKQGIEKNTNIEEAIKKMEEKKGVPPGQIQNFSYAATMNKIKEKKNMSDFAAKERDRRRRKMVVDQGKTQTDLDKKKNEEILIAKLLKKQAEEQKFAYLESRGQKCKELILSNRYEKAAVNDEKKKVQIQQLEQKRNEEYSKVIENYRKEVQDKKKYYSQVRREEKLKKRSVNIEICSEVIDLIMDVANEAFEEQKNKKKLDKPTWRKWMSHFEEGQLVSRAKRGLNQQDTFQIDDSQYVEYDILNDNSKNLDEVLDQMKYDQSYEDMMDYLGVNGIFNLTNGDFLEWNHMKEFSLGEGINLNFQFLDSLIPSYNPELGRSLQSLLQDIWKEDKTQVNEQQLVKVEGVPNYLPLKLCLLGKSYGGKRTIAKQLQDQYQGKVKVFKMEEMIKEVLDYINPKPVAEPEKVATKKAPAPKGKAEEVAPVDPYAGQDTKEYKEIGQQIKKMIGEVEITQGRELQSLINDDSLLVRLFIQKLKLTFPPEKSEEAKRDELLANVQREKEILEQLSELENQVPLDSKAKGKPAPSKKGGISNEEQLKFELDQLQKIQPEGWILLDFPRTLNQAKLMEKLMTGYTCMIDEQKSEYQKKFEHWSKLVTPVSSILDEDSQFNGQPFIYQSAMDGFIFLDVSSEECQRRGTNRKIDPQTGIIYHLEDNPPPENDNKLKDRLQEYNDPDADQNKQYYHHLMIDSSFPSLKKWVSGFGLKDEQIPTINAASILLEVQVQEKLKKEEVLERVLAQLRNVLSFKQAQYDYKKSQIKHQISQEQQNTQMSALQKESKLETLENNGDEDGGQNLGEEEQIQNDDTYLEAHRELSKGYSQQSKRSKASEMQVSKPLSDDEKRDIWSAFEQSYYKENLSVFKVVRRQRDLVLDGLNQMQNQFIDFLTRSDNKQQLVTDFIESFNKFSEEFPDLRQDQQTQDELLNRVNKLSNDLWAIVEQRKDEAIQQHSKMIQDGWVVNEMKKLIKNSIRIIQVEMNKFATIFKIIMASKHYQEVEVDSVFNNYSDDGVKVMEESDQKSPLLDKLYAYLFRLVQFQQDSLKTVDESKREMLYIESQNLLFRLNLIKTWTMLKLKEFYTFQRSLYETLDDWIVLAVQKENEQISKVITKLTQLINDHALKLDYSQLKIPYLDIEQIINRVQFQSTPIYLNSINLPTETHDKRLTVAQLEHFYKDFRFYAFDEFLDGQTFTHLIVLAFQENRVPKYWRYQSFQAFNRMISNLKATPDGKQSQSQLYSDENQVVEREFIDWKKILTMLILITNSIESNDEIDNYEAALYEQVENSQTISLNDFLKVSSFFDQHESISETVGNNENEDDEYGEEAPSDQQRLNQIKSLLYQTHQTNTQTLVISQFILQLKQIRNLIYGYQTPQRFFFNE